ncbi:MAG: hypothetical protein ACO1QS_13215 [Verrucomicrobiota bacterium]
MNFKLNRAFRPVELLSLTLTVGLLAGCSSEDSLDLPEPKPAPAAVPFDTTAVLTATAPEMAPPPGTVLAPETVALAAATNAHAESGEVPLYNIAPDDLVKHPKWGPVLQQLSQSCVAFFAAEKRVPGSVAEMQTKGFVKDLPALPSGMMFQIDAENYRVRLVSM